MLEVRHKQSIWKDLVYGPIFKYLPELGQLQQEKDLLWIKLMTCKNRHEADYLQARIFHVDSQINLINLQAESDQNDIDIFIWQWGPFILFVILAGIPAVCYFISEMWRLL